MTDDELELKRQERQNKLWALRDGPMAVQGYIDGYGAVHARITKVTETHTSAERLSGRCWRWMIWEQDWGPKSLGSHLLDKDDMLAVEEYLIKEGLYLERI